MTQSEVHALLNALQLEQSRYPELIETHISYVILTSSYAYKIKKPMSYSFLDFSTLDKRQFFCRRELELNRRLEPDVYLDVLPVRNEAGHWFIGGNKGEIIEYTVKMKRLKGRLQMDVLLQQKRVGFDQIDQLAHKVARFHQQAGIIRDKPSIAGEYMEDFDDILSVRNTIREHIDDRTAEILDHSVNKAREFLDGNQSFIQSRVTDGFIRDVHGDLHTRNIFLYDPPIIFDCIEFNDHFRQIDVLSEIGFLLMDLEAGGASHLAKHFLHKYLSDFRAIRSRFDRSLLLFFKAYRANVRAKVNALRLISKEVGYDHIGLISEIKKYLQLMDQYVERLDHQ